MRGFESSKGEGAAFPLTRWTLLCAAKGAPHQDRRQALGDLVRGYWRPLFAFLRASGRDREEAKDLVQGFFARMLEKDTLASFDVGKGRFRTFLLTCLKNYCANEYDREHAQCRGGPAQVVSIDWEGANEPTVTPGQDPEEAYDAAWAKDKMRHAVDRARAVMGEDSQTLSVIDAYLAAPNPSRPGYEKLALLSGLTEGQVRHLLHEFRARVKWALNEEIRSETTDNDAVVEEMTCVLKRLIGL